MSSLRQRITLESLNAYRIMWLFVLFDLPVDTKKNRKRATRFRKNILLDGFTMLQYSVYTRHCASRESAQVHIRRVRKMVPPEGQVSILQITDRQYGLMLNYVGGGNEPLKGHPSQLELF